MSTPLVPADLDLRDFAYMPVDVRRLLTSETWLTATGDEKAAAMTLWLESWHQVPAGSLPDNDRMLAILSQAGARWKKVRAAALRGWVKADDGRLYHPVVCEKALEAWDKKRAQRQRTEAARQARLNRTATDDVTEPTRHTTTGDVTRSVTDDVTASKGKGREEKEESSLRSPKNASRLAPDWQPSPEDLEYARAQGMPDGVVAREAENFRDYWVAKAGAGATKRDWAATWRTWIRKACERAGYRPQSPPANGATRTFDPRNDDDAKLALAAARARMQWSTPKWGAKPNTAGCEINPALILPTDGDGWSEWGT